MKDLSYFPRNFLRLPTIKGLAPSHKLILIALFIECESHVGCWVPADLREAANIHEYEETLLDLERRNLISIDRDTGEFFLCQFFRYNFFKSPARIGQARDAYARVVSERLRQEIRHQIEINKRFCLIGISDLSPPDKNPGSIPKQPLSSLGKGVGEGKGKGEEGGEGEDKPVMPACSAAFEKHLEALRAEGARVRNPNLEADRAKLQQLRELADAVGAGEVLRVIAAERYPSKALQAALNAGLGTQAVRRRTDEGELARRRIAGKTFVAEIDGAEYVVADNGESARCSTGGVQPINAEFLAAITAGRLVCKEKEESIA